MIDNKLEYRQKTAEESDVLSHLYKCDASFVPALSERVELSLYATKLFQNSLTFEAWQGADLVGLVAAYFNKPETYTVFVSNVSVVPTLQGKGIATNLIKHCVATAILKSFTIVKLEVDLNNLPAIALYHKIGFNEVTRDEKIIYLKLNLNNPVNTRQELVKP